MSYPGVSCGPPPSERRRLNVNRTTFTQQSKMMQYVVRGDVNSVKHGLTNGEDVNQSDPDKRTLLHAAAYFNRLDVAKHLISCGARLDAKDARWLTPLHYACKKNHDLVVEVLLSAGCEVEVRDKEWITPLHVCAANNSLECVKLFINRVGNVNASDRSGATALHHAASNGNCDMITFLLKKGCSPNNFDKKQRRPLHYAACVADNAGAIRLLIEAGAVINAQDKTHKTPLHFSAASGSVVSTMTLLDLGADICAVDAEGNNALHWAALHGQDDVIEEMLKHDISLINSVNNFGLTPLHLAAGSAKGISAVECLSRYPPNVININARDKIKRTPLHLAVKFGRFTSCQEFMMREDIEAVSGDHEMKTPLHYAVLAGDFRIIQILLQHPEVDPDVVDSSGLTPLHYAAFNGLSTVVQFLLTDEKKPASPYSLDITGRPPHFLAALSGDIESIKLLLPSDLSDINVFTLLDNFNRSPLHYSAATGSNGHDVLVYLLSFETEDGNTVFNVNQSDIFGRTPLHYASEFDYDGECVELLITHGAKINVVDNDGLYSLNYAAAAGHTDTVKKLLELFYWGDTTFSTCPSQCAAFYGHAECLDLLLNESLFQDLGKTIEYSRRISSSECFEVLQNFILNSGNLDEESIADLTHYFTASESFHQQFLSSETLNDLSKIDQIMGSRFSMDITRRNSSRKSSSSSFHSLNGGLILSNGNHPNDLSSDDDDVIKEDLGDFGMKSASNNGQDKEQKIQKVIGTSDSDLDDSCNSVSIGSNKLNNNINGPTTTKMVSHTQQQQNGHALNCSWEEQESTV